MVFITAEAYKDAGVDIITVKKNKDHFWVKMKDVEKRLGIKNMSDRIRHKMCGIFVIKNLTEKQGKQYVRSKNEIDKNLKNNLFKYSRSDITANN